MRGRTLKLYLVNGDPSGVITAELGISSVRAVFASRTSLPDLIKREEAARTGVYLLQGPDPSDPAREKVYVGEGDQVRSRLSAHDADEAKDFFTKAVLIVSKDENLTKAHGRYIESRLIEMIRQADRASLANSTQPVFKGLPEPEIADMERVIDEVEILLPILGFDVLRRAGRRATEEQSRHALNPDFPPDQSKGFLADETNIVDRNEVRFVAEIKDARAEGVERAGEFVVLSGSTAYRYPNDSLSAPLRSRHESLRRNGVLKEHENPELLIFTEDVSFGSPSAASSLVGGYSDSGPRTWRVKGTSTSYKQWRQRRFEQ